MKKRIFWICLFSLLSLTCLAGCRKSKENPLTGEEEEEKTLVYWTMWEKSSPQGKVIKEAADMYRNETGIKVTVQYKGQKALREALEVTIQEGEQIDIFDDDIDRLNSVWSDYLMDLEELAAAADYEEKSQGILMESARAAGGGTLKSLPYAPNVFTFYYNRDLFDQAGVTKDPETWEELTEACRKLAEAGITPITSDDDYVLSLLGYHLARLVGEERVVQIVTEEQWDDPAVLRAVKDYEELAAQGAFSKYMETNIWPSAQVTEFAGGTAAIYLNGSWLPNEAGETAGEEFRWGAFSYPALEGGVNGRETVQIGAKAFGINKDSESAKEAFDFIELLTRGELDQKIAEESLGIPSDKTNRQWPAELQSTRQVFQKAEKRFTWAAGIETNEAINDVLRENFLQVCAGNITAEEFVTNMQAAGLE